MNIAIFCCSPKQETSVTLKTIHFLQNMCKDDIFNIQIIGGNPIFNQAHAEAIAESELVIFATPLMQYGLPSQLMYFMENMLIAAKDTVANKPFAFYTISNKILDDNAKKYIKHFFADNSLKLLPILSLNTNSILGQYGQNELLCWETYIKTLVIGGNNVPFASPCNIVVFDTSDGTDNEVNTAIMNIQSDYIRRGSGVNIINLRNFNIQCCTSCESCITSRKCIYAKTDDFENLRQLLFTNIQIIQFVGTLKHGMPHPMFKAWIERFHANGVEPRQSGIIWNYLVSNSASDSDIESFSEFVSTMNNYDGDIFTGVDRISNYASHISNAVAAYNSGFAPAESFASASMRMILQRQAEEFRNVAPNDYKFFSKMGAYNQIMPNPAYSPVYNADSALAFRQARIMPYQMMINQLMFPGMYNQPMMNGGMPGYNQPMMNGGMPSYGQPPYGMY